MTCTTCIPGGKRYFMRTGYHWWSVMDRTNGKTVRSYSANKHGGDEGARKLAYQHLDSLNNPTTKEA